MKRNSRTEVKPLPTEEAKEIRDTMVAVFKDYCQRIEKNRSKV
jgi:hypothetical protein